MPDIRLCLLGAGRWGRRYIDTIRDLAGVQLSALASRNPDSKAFVPATCRVFGDWRDAVVSPDIDAIIVATPPHLHAAMALAAIAAGRPVLVEKPLTLSPGDAMEIETASTRGGVLTIVGHTHLFNPAYREMKRQVPTIGSIVALRAAAGNWGPFRSDVTPLWDWAPHDLAMCMDLMRGPPRTFSAEQSVERVEDGWGGMYRLALGFENGESADIRLGNLMRPKARLFEIKGSHGDLVLDDVAGTLVRRQGGVDSAIPFPAERPLAVLVHEFAEAVKKGQQTDPSLGLGVSIVNIIARIAA